MHVLILGLEVKDIPPPAYRLHVCKDQHEVERLLLNMAVSLIVMPEALAPGMIERLNVFASETQIAVVVSEHKQESARGWTSKGVAWVWPQKNWEQHLKLTFDTPEPEPSYSGAEYHAEHTYDQPTLLIAVAGAFDGAGSTHLSFAIANYLAKQGSGKVALWEAGRNPCFEYLAFNRTGEMNTKPRFEMDKVTCFKGSADIDWVESYAEQFRYLIVDVGNLNTSEHAHHFFRANIPVLVGSGSSWRQRELAQLCRKHIHKPQEKWRIVLPMASEDARDELAEALAGRQVIALPVCDPYHLSDEAEEVIQRMLQISVRKPARLFGRLLKR
ncbi:hypothetical protein [Paenibacillus sinopodophylli]|uniref:hypothetical protein n=1 Tax=Paenibacillus sinopodophylli TaxID=1837342 RepID=UPI00110CF5D3|nr:hypothetical protein [Paenibacillus sinopodophylli]